MIEKVLEIINQEMIGLGIDYHFMTNDKEKVTYPYVTGEYYEAGYSSENAKTTGQLLLEGWQRGLYSDLISVANSIKNHFDELQIVTDDVAIAFDFNTFNPLRTDDPELKKFEIYIDIVYWKGK